MTTPTPTAETRELCPDCGNAPARTQGEAANGGFCHGWQTYNCLYNTVTRLRAELSTLRERSQHLDEAARILATIPDTATLELNGGAGWPAHCAWLLAHRGQETDGNR